MTISQLNTQNELGVYIIFGLLVLMLPVIRPPILKGGGIRNRLGTRC